MKKIFNFLFSRAVIVGALLAVQALILLVTVWKFSSYFVYIYAGFAIMSLVAVLYIINNKDNPAYKLAWIIPILVFPVFGGLFYLIFGINKSGNYTQKKMDQIGKKIMPSLNQDTSITDEISHQDKSVLNQINYIYKYSSYPIYKNTTSEYLTPGEKKFERLKEELEKAEHYIFLEYFIIEQGVMWDSILEILIRKAKQGVDIRVIYDDVGSLFTLPYKYNQILEKNGVKCKVFNPFVPVLSIKLNNRDHRKILVIDGHTAFTGGINLADEYINEYNKYGHWKDSSIMIKGEAVWSFTVMFLSVWDYLNNSDESYEQYKPRVYHEQNFLSDGYVMPYGDSPLDNETIGEFVYLNMINRAKDYVFINTPYLIVDNELVTALSLAAKSGVDVRIVTPHIPDKWYVHAVTRAYYSALIESGVKIYEYTPGFIHAKTFAVDDELAIVGTINLDYRSLYLHFECAVLLYKTQSVLDVKNDFIETLKVCQQITVEDCQKVKWHVKIFRSVLRLFAPLM